MEIHDQLGRTLSFKTKPQRIICLVPSLTELLVDLGLRARLPDGQENLVGITKFCVHPKNLRKEKTIVGGTKTVHLDKIKALRPDIILCNKEENTPEIVASCSEIAPVHVSDIETLQDVYELIRQYGEIFDVEDKAKDLIAKLQSAEESFRGSLKQKENETIKTAYLIWRKPWMAAGRGTFIDHLLQLNGLENQFKDDLGRYPEIQMETLAGADLVLLSSEPFPFKEKHIDEIRAFTDAKILLVDGEYFSWYGSRLLQAFDYFKSFQKQLNDQSSFS